MNFYAVLLICIYLSVFCLISLKFKQKDTVVVFALLAIVAIYLGGNTENPDYATYQYTYNMGIENEIEFLYTAFVTIGKALGFSYQIFRLELYCLALLLLYFAVSRISKTTLVFWIYYCIFPMMLDGTQTRNFIAMTIVVNAIIYLINYSKENVVKFCILIILATGFQVLSVFYLILLLIPYVQNNKIIRNIIIGVITISVVIALNRSALNSLLSNIVSVLGDVDPRVEKYGSIQTRYGFLYSWLYHLVIIGISALIRKQINNMSDVDPQIINLIDFGYWLSIVSIVYFPFYVLVATFDRIYRTILVFEYIVWVTALKGNQVRLIDKGSIVIRKEAMPVYSIIICFCGFLFFMKIYSLYKETIVKPFFDDNWILFSTF